MTNKAGGKGKMREMGMKILVTGGAGYIGGTVTRLLLKEGHEVVVYDSLRNKDASMVAKGAKLVEGDIGNAELLGKVLADKFDGVMHFAALIEAGESMQRPETFFRNNTASTLNLFEAMLKTGHNKLVFSSTAACYGEPESSPIHEDAKLKPTNVYGESKLMVEHMLRWLNQIYGFRYASLRYFNVAGAVEGYGEAHEPESHLIPLILDVAMGRRKSIRVYGSDYPTPDGTCVRDYIHVSDLADAHLLALKGLEGESRLIYNIGNGQGFTVREVIDSVRRVTGKAIAVEEHGRRPGDPAVLVASSEKIIRELGWSPKFKEIDQIIESAWAWHREFYAGKA